MFKSVLTPPTCKRSGLEGKLVVDIAAGGKIRDSNDVYLALTDKGEVYSWGAGDFRRCGSAASTLLSGGKDPTETSKKKVPRVIDQLRGLSVVRVFCGGWAPGSGTLCLALCKNGTVYTWGQAFGTAHEPPSMVDPLASSVEYPKG